MQVDNREDLALSEGGDELAHTLEIARVGGGGVGLNAGPHDAEPHDVEAPLVEQIHVLGAQRVVRSERAYAVLTEYGRDFWPRSAEM